MSLPYRWHPSGTMSKALPEVGDLVAWEHAVWRVIEVTERPAIHWTDEDRAAVLRYAPEYRQIHKPHAVRLRPVERDDANADLHLRCGGRIRAWWDVYQSEHWKACGKCREPMPCREMMADRITEEAMHRVDRWSNPSACPACGEPITLRQRAHTFQHNLNVPGGPPVTFHVGRRGCRYNASEYRDRLVADGHDIGVLDFGAAS